MSSPQPQDELFALAPAELAHSIRLRTLDLFTRSAQPRLDELIEPSRIRRIT
jgi:hypothetical protein